MKSVSLFSISSEVTAEHIVQALSHHDAVFVDFTSPTQAETSGFAPVIKDVEGEHYYIHNVQNKLLQILFKERKKSVPASVIKDYLDEERERVKMETGIPMTKREEKAFKEELKERLLAHTHPKTTLTEVYIDCNSHVAYVGSGRLDYGVDILARLSRALVESGLPILNVEVLTKEYPFCSSIKKLLLEKYFSSEHNKNSDLSLLPTGTYTIIGENQIGQNTQNSKMTLKNIGYESDELFQALKGSSNRLVEAIGLCLEDDGHCFVVSENMTLSGVQIAGLVDFDLDAMSLEDYLKTNLVLKINAIAKMHNAVVRLLNYVNDQEADNNTATTDTQ